ncbi:molybdopterin dinucleotide binding domain-containing protein [Tolypothrix bouteillei VB521301_2]|uniref:Molybdopterin dinucleotide-binding domain-containing protein n=1 Tax=Tolypothrix bouteillei VB521301 TaxID=1479485 RepID=A0A0C1R2A1_9CYAN
MRFKASFGSSLYGVRQVQIHPKVAQAAGINNGDPIVVKSPRESIKGTALIWEGIREGTIFVPNWFGPQQKMCDRNNQTV